MYLVFLNTLVAWSWRMCVREHFNNCSIFRTVPIIPLCLDRLHYAVFKLLLSKGECKKLLNNNCLRKDILSLLKNNGPQLTFSCSFIL